MASLCELYVAGRRTSALAALVVTMRPYFAGLPKAKTAKLVRSVIDALARIPGSEGAQVALCTETIEWARAEKRSFLRMRLELRLAALLVGQRKYAQALALVNELLREGKRLDDKSLLLEIHVLETRLHHGLRALAKVSARGRRRRGRWMGTPRGACVAVVCVRRSAATSCPAPSLPTPHRRPAPP